MDVQQGREGFEQFHLVLAVAMLWRLLTAACLLFLLPQLEQRARG